MKASGIQLRFMLNYRSEEEINRSRNIYPMFESFRMLKNLRRVSQDTIYDIDKFELTYFPSLYAIYKLDIRDGKNSRFFLLTTSDVPTLIHSVGLGETIKGNQVFFKMMFHFQGATPLLTGYLFRKHRSREKVVEKKVFDFPIEIVFGYRNLISKIFKTRERFLKRYDFREEEFVYGPFRKPLGKEEEECEYKTIRYIHKFVTFSHEVV